MTYALPGPWSARANCAGLTDLMSSDHEHSIHALTICAGCPVITPCRNWALTDPDPAYGMIAGGLTPRQRRRMRSQRRRAS